MATLDLKTFHKSNSIELSINKLTNFDAEIAVIGCLLWDNRSYEKISDFLDEQHFSDENNKKIFKVIKRLLDQNILVTPITLKNHLENNKENELDNLSYLNQIKDSTPSTHNAYQYASLLYDLHIKRSLISIGNEIIYNSSENKNTSSNVMSPINHSQQSNGQHSQNSSDINNKVYDYKNHD